MQNLHKWAVRGMAAFLDYGIGIFVVGILSAVEGSLLEWWMVLLSGFLALVPDLDLVLPLLRDRYDHMSEHHTSLMHRPLVVLPCATALAYALGGEFWATATVICVSWHFFHDKKYIGDSDVELLWPIPRRITGYQDPPYVDGRTWLKEKWAIPSVFALTELTSGSVALAIGLFLTLGWEFAVGMIMFCWFGFILVWSTSANYRLW